jgi:hypothetical protein
MESKNLGLYGSPSIPWERAEGQLEGRAFHGGEGTYRPSPSGSEPPRSQGPPDGPLAELREQPAESTTTIRTPARSMRRT